MKLTYFDIHGGRGEPIRLAMFLGKLDFHDHRFPFSDFSEVRKSTPLGQVPTLEMNGNTITQCNAITRYVGKLANLYPVDPFKGLLCDEIMEAVEDISYRLVGTFGMSGEELKVNREKILKHYILPQLQWLDSKLVDPKGYFVGERLSVADLKVFVYLSWLVSSTLDHIPQDILKENTPKLEAYLLRIKSMPEIIDYYNSIS